MRATEFLKEVDRAIAQCGPFDHCCKPGCHHCCAEPAYATDAEIDDIVDSLTDAQKDAVRERLEIWIKKVRHLLPRSMPNAFEWRWQEAMCPLLESGMCMVYEKRPMGCRQFYAKENPDHCRMPARIKQKYANMNPELFVPAVGLLLSQNPVIILDNMGVLLAERLLNRHLQSGSRSCLRVTQP